MYRIPEADLVLPEPLKDRSVNVLSFVEPDTQVPFQIVINRDELLGDESIEQCFDRQIGLLTRHVKQFKLVRRSVTEREGSMQPIHMITTSFVQAGKLQHQLQTMLQTTKPRQLLVITLASAIPINEGHQRLWSQLIMPLDPRIAS
ncbi:DcrB-related protein [Pelomonas sp. KK5]|uniref:DcrB-related protein n=1 Tax=Pelomonas sp. KK5 TaxID=1855730 RepID=UPI00097C0C2B|nr:DcrB-related protein [Pelomonas sp. KK5]